MMAIKNYLIILLFVSMVYAQRPPFAGSRPIGFPEVTTETGGLGDRFGEVNATTQRLPIDALGDRELVDRLSKLPIDKQPFWLVNWQAIEEHRKKPQTYPQRPSPFVTSIIQNGNTGTGNTGNINTQGQSGGTAAVTTSTQAVNAGSINSNIDLGNRNSEIQSKFPITNLNSTTTRSYISSTPVKTTMNIKHFFGNKFGSHVQDHVKKDSFEDWDYGSEEFYGAEKHIPMHSMRGIGMKNKTQKNIHEKL